MNFETILLSQTNTQNQLLEEVKKNPGVIRTYLEGLVPSLLGFLVQVIMAFVILGIGSRIIKAIVRMLGKFLDKGRTETGVVTFLCSFVKYALYFVLAMIILSQFGVTTSSVVAVLGSAGLTMGLALQGSLSNFAGGVLILLLKPFVVGDYIMESATGHEGTVSEITIFYTELLTIDNQLVMVPNGTLSNCSITNMTHMEKRRIDLLIGVSYDADLKLVKEVLKKTAEQDPSALLEEPLDVYVSELGESAVMVGLRVWVKTEDYWPARWRLIEQIKNRLDAHHITIPYPQLDVKIKDGEGKEQKA